MSGLPQNLWRTIYDIQGEAQQAAEGDRPCRSIEDTWARLEKVLPPPYSAGPDLLEALNDLADWADEYCRHDKAPTYDAIWPARRAIAKATAEGTET